MSAAKAPAPWHKASLGVNCPGRRQVRDVAQPLILLLEPAVCHNTSLQVTVASVFGVGAPEALLVGVVALVVFGPKGLAEVC